MGHNVSSYRDGRLRHTYVELNAGSFVKQWVDGEGAELANSSKPSEGHNTEQEEE